MIKAISSFEQYQKDYKQSLEFPDVFWSTVAENFIWQKKWDQIQSGNFLDVNHQWFVGAQLNITENCLDRFAKSQPYKTAIIWEPNNPNDKAIKITYQQLYHEVCQFANALLSLGIKKGDVVCIYMPMIPQLTVAMFACARIGAIHSVVFGGFSAQSIADRILDANCKWIITADGNYRGDKPLHLKKIVDEALLHCPSVQKCIVFNHSNFKISMNPNRDVYWNEITKNISTVHHAVTMDAEEPLFILYTSGSTGKPKGVLHTTAGYMVWAAFTFANVFQYKNDEVFWCTADIGWVTGHSYIVYGPLLNGATVLMFEGVPQFPDYGRWWQIIEKHQVNIFYTAPTAIRSLEAQGLKWFERKNLSSLRVLGSVGEPINEEAWHWFNDHVGNNNCPIVDTWWQTETGGIMISSLAGVTPSIPSYATFPLPGVEPVIVDNNGNILTETETEGNLCIARSWPGQARTVFGDHERFIQTYFNTFKGKYFTGDGCRRNKDCMYRITGRVDDVINVSGHRIGTAEVENAINENEFVVESAVVGYPHPIKGQALFAFVICTQNLNENILRESINENVSRIIGSFAKPDKILMVNGLPKTRSGKIMRRILRKIAEGQQDQIGDTTTLLNPEVVDEIKTKCQTFS